MLNLHCNKNGKAKKYIYIKKNKKNMRLPRFESRKYGFKIQRGVHYAMEADGINR